MMMSKAKRRLLVLRWPLLAGFLFYAAHFLFVRPTLKAAEIAALCGLAWFFLSQKKIRQIDSRGTR